MTPIQQEAMTRLEQLVGEKVDVRTSQNSPISFRMTGILKYSQSYNCYVVDNKDRESWCYIKLEMIDYVDGKSIVVKWEVAG